VPREIPQQVATWDPCRQREVLIGGGTFDVTLDLEMVTVEIGQTNSILDQRSVLRANARRLIVAYDSLQKARRTSKVQRGGARAG
jgi:hypothetical protein